MSGVKYIKEDLLNSPDLVIAHGCNAQGVMNSGVAKAIRRKYPQAYNSYRGKYIMTKMVGPGSLYMGTVIPAFIYDADGKLDKVVCNCITQQFYGNDGRCYVDYNSITASLMETAKIAIYLGQDSFSIPKIGAGLGGGDWSKIEELLNFVCFETDITINVYAP